MPRLEAAAAVGEEGPSRAAVAEKVGVGGAPAQPGEVPFNGDFSTGSNGHYSRSRRRQRDHLAGQAQSNVRSRNRTNRTSPSLEKIRLRQSVKKL